MKEEKQTSGCIMTIVAVIVATYFFDKLFCSDQQLNIAFNSPTSEMRATSFIGFYIGFVAVFVWIVAKIINSITK